MQEKGLTPLFLCSARFLVLCAFHKCLFLTLLTLKSDSANANSETSPYLSPGLMYVHLKVSLTGARWGLFL